MKKFIIPGSTEYFFYDEKETTEDEVSTYLNAVRASLPDLKRSDLELQDLLSSGGLKYALQKQILERDFSVPTLMTFSVIVPDTQAQVDTLNGVVQAYHLGASAFRIFIIRYKCLIGALNNAGKNSRSFSTERF